jgi:hypothetical protein
MSENAKLEYKYDSEQLQRNVRFKFKNYLPAKLFS